VNDQNAHLTSETLQAFLEGELPRDRAHQVEHHLTGCARCASELDAWQLLFAELDEMPALGPSQGFTDRVMGQVSTRPSLARRLADRVQTALRRPMAEPGEHLSPERIQDLLEGALGSRQGRAARAHLGACVTCREEVEEWEELFTSLAAVPRLAPSKEFHERVMAGVRVVPRQAPKPVTARLPRLVEWAGQAAAAGRRLVPSTGRGWAWLAGTVSLPGLGVLAVLGAVLAHPLLSLEGLAHFARWRVADGVQAFFAWSAAWLVDSPMLATIWEMTTSVVASPGAALAGIIALWTLVLVSGWVFYKNVIAPSITVGHHA
jgi:anti-sigma factor RsiW